MRRAVLCYLIRVRDGRPDQVCLAEKQSGYVAGYLTGAGGKVEPGETPETAAARELLEEQDVHTEVSDLQRVALLDFCFPHEPQHDLECHVFTTERWEGTPRASAVMGEPQWYDVAHIPYDRLPPADAQWFPQMLNGKRFHTRFDLDERYRVLRQEVLGPPA